MRASLAAAYGFGVAMLGVTLPTPLYPLYQERLGFSTLLITIIYAAYAVGVIGTLVLLGSSSDYWGRRPVLLIALGCSGLSAVSYLTEISLPAIFAGRVLSGLSAGLFTGTATAYVMELAPPHRRGQATLLAAAVNTGGIGAGPLIAGVMSQYLPAPLHAVYVLDLALVALAVAVFIRLPETVTSIDRRLDLRPNLTVPAGDRAMFVRAAVSGAAGYAVFGYFLAVAPSALLNQFSVHNHAVVGGIICSLFAFSLLGQVAAPRLGDERALSQGCLVLILGMGLLAAALSTSDLVLLIAGAVIAGAGQGLSFRAGVAVIRALSPEQHAGRIASTFFVILYIAISTTVIGIGCAAQTLGLRDTGIATALIVAILAGICGTSLTVLHQ